MKFVTFVRIIFLVLLVAMYYSCFIVPVVLGVIWLLKLIFKDKIEKFTKKVFRFKGIIAIYFILVALILTTIFGIELIGAQMSKVDKKTRLSVQEYMSNKYNTNCKVISSSYSCPDYGFAAGIANYYFKFKTEDGKVFTAEYHGHGLKSFDDLKVDLTVKNGSKYGYLDENLNLAIPYEYDAIKSVEKEFSVYSKEGSNYLILYKYDGGKGLATKKGEILLDCEYKTINYGEVRLDNSEGLYKEEYFDEDNKYIEIFFVVEKDDQYAILDGKGNIKIDFCDMGNNEIRELYETKVKESLKVEESQE